MKYLNTPTYKKVSTIRKNIEYLKREYPTVNCDKLELELRRVTNKIMDLS